MINGKNTFALTAMLLIAMSALVSADDNMDNGSQIIQLGSAQSTNMTFQTVVKTLYAGQNINVGTLNISNDCQNLTITYEMAGNWTLQETHLEVASSLENVPMTRSGNPIVGHFTYKNDELPEGTIIDTCVIPMSGKNGTVYIAAHAVVSNHTSEEGAWASGTQFPGNNWATYFTYDIINYNEEENDGEDNKGDDAEENEGNDGEDNEGNDAEDNEGDDAEDSEGDNGEDANNGKKSSSSGQSRMVVVSETANSEDNSAYMSTDLEEDLQPPVTSVPEPVYETEEPATLAEKGSSFLWIIIAMLLSCICIMSGYGLTYP